MPEPNPFEYAIVRVVPHVEREEFMNVGVIVFCRAARFLQARLKLDTQRLTTLAPDLDPATVQEQLDLVHWLCAGGPGTGEIGALPQPDRFRWITSPRSTSLQFSAIHCGLCDDPHMALDEIFDKMIG